MLNSFRILPLILLFIVYGCGSSQSTGIDPEHPPEGNDSTGTTFQPITESIPEGNQYQGFFLDKWKPKKIGSPAGYDEKKQPDGELDSRIQINTKTIITKVPTEIYGNNANPYNNQMGDEPKLIGYLNDLKPHLIRFPGGNLSNLYFWDREPGDKPDDVPPADSLLKANGDYRNDDVYWYGKNNTSWTMSLDNYYKFLQETNSKGIITVNFSYARYGLGADPVAAAAGYAADWVRYDNGRTKYWEIGNENYGDWQSGYRIDTTKNRDNQPEFISGKLYAIIANVFIDSMKQAANQIGTDIKIGTQLIEQKPESYDTNIIKDWNNKYFESAGGKADYYIVHNYYTPFQQNSKPSVILKSASEVTKDMMQWMNETTNTNNAKLKPVALTEWNIFAEGSQQQVSDISGMHAAMTLGELIKYKFGAAMRWDIANAWDGGNDHGMFNSPNGKAPDAPVWQPRPVFYYMYYFQRYFGDTMVWSGTRGNKSLKSYASTFSSGQIGLIVANTDSAKKIFDVNLKSSDLGNRYYWYQLSGERDKQFSRKVFINTKGPSGVSGGPADYTNILAYSASVDDKHGIKLTIQGRSVIYLLIER